MTGSNGALVLRSRSEGLAAPQRETFAIKFAEGE